MASPPQPTPEAIWVKRISFLLTGVALSALMLVPLTGAAAAPGPARSALFSTVMIKKTSAGKILVNTSGSILYEFTKDSKNKDKCAAISGCTSTWLPQPVQGKPSGGPGVKKALLSSIPMAGGGRQVTYAGHPLYIYEAAPTDTEYIGASQFGGKWYAIGAKGQAIK